MNRAFRTRKAAIGTATTRRGHSFCRKVELISFARSIRPSAGRMALVASTPTPWGFGLMRFLVGLGSGQLPRHGRLNQSITEDTVHGPKGILEADLLALGK